MYTLIVGSSSVKRKTTKVFPTDLLNILSKRRAGERGRDEEISELQLRSALCSKKSSINQLELIVKWWRNISQFRDKYFSILFCKQKDGIKCFRTLFHSLLKKSSINQLELTSKRRKFSQLVYDTFQRGITKLPERWQKIIKQSKQVFSWKIRLSFEHKKTQLFFHLNVAFRIRKEKGQREFGTPNWCLAFFSTNHRSISLNWSCETTKAFATFYVSFRAGGSEGEENSGVQRRNEAVTKRKGKGETTPRCSSIHSPLTKGTLFLIAQRFSPARG